MILVNFIIFIVFYPELSHAFDAHDFKNEEVVNQMNGNYGELNREEDLPLAAIQKVWDHSDGEDSIYTVCFNPKKNH